MRRVAIVGCSFRFPGTTSENYWADLLNGKDMITEVDSDRWAVDTFRHPDKNHHGTSYSFASGSLGDVAGFDAGFFGISPREAAQMDPQQRLLLELTWEALENSGIRPCDIRGSKCGVFIGISSADYSMRFADDLDAIDSMTATGNTSSIAANRISYVFDLRGPSMAIDTACSSSLVAFHQACQSIAVGESQMAIAGGVSLLLHPFGFVAFSKSSMLSRKGICNVFDADGDGYVRSEGGGIFLLKEYEQALADGDNILALVGATVVNSDGKKSGLTVPSIAAQTALLTEAYAKANIAPADISYIEAHGTGTAVGDPVETNALANALGTRRPAGSPLLIGSVKSNLGHLEAASGVAGLVKALHCIKHRSVPATIHLSNPNPNIPFQDWNLKVVTQTTALPSAGRIVIGVNSFGFGGSNAHAILENPFAKVSALRPRRSEEFPPVRIPLFLSGKSESALKFMARQFATHLRLGKDADFYDMAYHSAFRREWHENRAVVFGGTPHVVASALEHFSDGTAPHIPVIAATALSPAPALAFVYSGNGSQWDGMGRRLLLENSIFKAAVQAVENIFEKFGDFSIEEELMGRNGSGRYERTEIAQPALFAVQVGVTEMLRSQGLAPAAVVGHSVGEIAAAWAAGALTLEQAVKVIYYRSLCQGMTKGLGGMTAVALAEMPTRAMLEAAGVADDVAIAGVNSPRGVTVAGPVSSLTLLETLLSEHQVIFKRLDLDYAFHSQFMDSIQGLVEQSLERLVPHKGVVDFMSAVTGEFESGTTLDASYWWQNIRQPVLFEKAIAAIQQRGTYVFVEVGPHGVLQGYLNECLKTNPKSGRAIATLTRGDDSPERVWSAAARAILAGVPANLACFFPEQGRFAELPNYPWQRERHWQDATADSHNLLQRHKVHPMLGYALGQQELTWENQIDPRQHPQLADHVVGGSMVFPGSGFAEIGLAAAAQWTGDGTVPLLVELEELELKMFLVLSQERTKLLRVSIDPSDGRVAISARDQSSTDAWTLHANGRILTQPLDISFEQEAPRPPERAPDFDASLHAACMRRVGLEYGPAFQAIDVGWVEGDTAWARLTVPASIAASVADSLIHYALMDSAFQLVFHLVRDQTDLPTGVAFLPSKIERMKLRTGMGTPTTARAQLTKRSPHGLTADFTLFDEAGDVIAWLRGVRFRSVRIGKYATDSLSLLTYTAVPRAHAQADLPKPGVVAGRLQVDLLAAARTLSDENSGHFYFREVDPLLEALCVSFAAQAFTELSNQDGELTQPMVNLLVEQHPQGADMLGQLVEILEEDGSISRTASGWQLRDLSDLPKSVDIWNALVADHPDYFPVINAVASVGLNMVAIIQGQVSRSRLLPPDCSLHSLLAQNFDSFQRSQLDRIVAAAAQVALEQLTEGQRLHIIEVSDGPPALWAGLRRALPADRCDVSFATGNVETSESIQRQADRWPELVVRDIGQDVAPAPAARFAQLVIVRNDFRSTVNAEIALDFASKVLASEGVLLWLGTASSRWFDLLTRDDGRSSYTPIQWREQLEQRDLALSETVSFAPAYATAPYAIVGQCQRRSQALAHEPAQGSVWLIVAGGGNESQQVAVELTHMLEVQGGQVVVSEPELDACDSLVMSDLLDRVKTRHGKLTGIVHLHGLLTGASALNSLEMLSHQVQRAGVAAALVQACERTRTSTTCWLVTVGAATRLLPGRQALWEHTNDAPLYGLGRTLLNEPSHLKVRLLDVEPVPVGGKLSGTICRALRTELLAPDATESEVIMTAAGERFVPRLRVMSRAAQSDTPAVKPAGLRLVFQSQGRLQNLRWETVSRSAPRDDEVVIKVAATGLNFRDVMYTLGMLPDEAVESGIVGPTLGLECSGVIAALGSAVTGFAVGDRVLAFGASCFADQVITRSSAVVHLPSSVSFEEAATLHCAFFTAYYAVHHLARLSRGESILIHGAAGGVGIAALQIAKHLGAVVFATAGTDEKRDFLRLLGADHIFDSRSLGFADQIMAVTHDMGIDVVLNSLAGEAINRNLKLLKPFGRFLELGKRDFYENTKVGLRAFRNNISYFGVDADQIMEQQPALTESLVKEVMALFAQGVLHPLPLKMFEADDVIEAFRYMQLSQHIGKVVVTYRNGINRFHTPAPASLPLRLNSDATYLVTGGLGGFGLKTAQWLASKGARNLVLISRSGPVAVEARDAISALELQGVKVLAQACDATDLPALTALFAQVDSTMPPLRGAIHAATVIDDALIRNITLDQLQRTFAPKILGARHLHDLTKHRSLDFFVLYSSATTLFGNPGQGAYVAANAYLESLVEARRSAGLAGLCVRWGPIEDVGFLARNKKIKQALQSRMGGAPILSDDALAMLEDLMVSNRSDLGVLALEWNVLSRNLPSANEPKFGDLAAYLQTAKSAGNQSNDIRAMLDEMSPGQLTAVFQDLLKAEIGEILRIAPDKIDPERPLYDVGLDSLMGVELGLAIESRFGIQLSVLAFSDSPTVSKLVEKIISQLVAAPVADQEPVPADLLLDQVQQAVNQHSVDVGATAVAQFHEDIKSGSVLQAKRILQ